MAALPSNSYSFLTLVISDNTTMETLHSIKTYNGSCTFPVYIYIYIYILLEHTFSQEGNKFAISRNVKN